MSQQHKILIVGPAWVGDMVMAQTLFRLLKSRNTSVCIDVLAPAWTRPLLARMDEVHGAFDMPVGHGQLLLGERWKLAQQLKAHQYQQAIVLPNSLKSALIPAFAGIETRTGWRGEMRFGLINDIRKLDKKRYPLMVDRFAALAFESGKALPATLPLPKLSAEFERLPALFEKYQLHTQTPILVLCPGAEFGPAKRWPEAHYAEVASHHIERGGQVWIFGSQKDRDVAENIATALTPAKQQHCKNLAGITSLEDAIDLMSQAAAVVSNDSGLMHVAAALGRKLVVVYGSTSPLFTPPLAEKVAIIASDLDCAPCFQRECPLQHLNCLKQISAQQVIAQLEALG